MRRLGHEDESPESEQFDEQRTPPSDGPAADPDDLFQVLSDGQRRRVVRVLRERDEPTSLDDLVATLAADEAGSTEQLRLALRHVHLPMLADAGSIRYDAETGQVVPLDRLEEFVAVIDSVQ